MLWTPRPRSGPRRPPLRRPLRDHVRVVDALRPSQLDLLARHRLHSLAVLLAPSASYAAGAQLQDTDEGRALLALPRDMLASAAIAAAAATAGRHSLAQRRRSRGERRAAIRRTHSRQSS